MNPAQLRRVNIESFAHYRQGLAELLLDTIQQGSSVGFLADLNVQQALDYFDSLKTSVAEGNRFLWAVVKDERVMASVQLVLCQRTTALNRAEVEKLLVHSNAQRRGLGQQLMAAVEQTAGLHKRGLLHLDIEAGSPGEAFYRAMGYSRGGQIPAYACSPDGEYKTTAFYYKLLRVN